MPESIRLNNRVWNRVNFSLSFFYSSSFFCIATKFNPQQQSGTQFVMTQLIRQFTRSSMLKIYSSKRLGFCFSFGFKKGIQGMITHYFIHRRIWTLPFGQILWFVIVTLAIFFLFYFFSEIVLDTMLSKLSVLKQKN